MVKLIFIIYFSSLNDITELLECHGRTNMGARGLWMVSHYPRVTIALLNHVVVVDRTMSLNRSRLTHTLYLDRKNLR